MKIYTKKGDSGKTSLLGGKRTSKDNLRIETCGEIDELNSILGVCRSNNSVKAIDTILREIQSDLFVLCVEIANPHDKIKVKSKCLDDSTIKRIENHIDALTPQLEVLTNFIFPGGNRCASMIHLARAVCRRAERRAVSLSKKENIGKYPLIYLNRLSDLLFILARWSNALSNIHEEKWIHD